MPEGCYERAEAAAKCGVHGCMLVPLFPHKDLTLAGPVAVLELIQLESDVSCFPPLFTWLLEKLPVCTPLSITCKFQLCLIEAQYAYKSQAFLGRLEFCSRMKHLGRAQLSAAYLRIPYLKVC